MLDRSRIKHKGLRLYWDENDGSKIDARWRAKVGRILNALDIAVSPEELDLPGYGFHELKGNRRGTYAVFVSRNWRITFTWSDEGPNDVDLEDYHG